MRNANAPVSTTSTILSSATDLAAVCVVISSLLVSSAVADSAAGEATYSYYCPKGNGVLIGDDHFLTGRVGIAFPDGLTNAKSQPTLSPPLNWTMADCSSDAFYCLDVTAKQIKSKRRIFVPRKPVIGMSYQYGGATAFVSASASSDLRPAMQVVISQQLDGRMVKLKLTIRDGTGVVLLDGINLWNPLNYKKWRDMRA